MTTLAPCWYERSSVAPAAIRKPMGKATKTAPVTQRGCRRRVKMWRWWAMAGHAGMRKVPKKALLVKTL